MYVSLICPTAIAFHHQQYLTRISTHFRSIFKHACRQSDLWSVIYTKHEKWLIVGSLCSLGLVSPFLSLSLCVGGWHRKSDIQHWPSRLWRGCTHPSVFQTSRQTTVSVTLTRPAGDEHWAVQETALSTRLELNGQHHQACFLHFFFWAPVLLLYTPFVYSDFVCTLLARNVISWITFHYRNWEANCAGGCVMERLITLVIAGQGFVGLWS